MFQLQFSLGVNLALFVLGAVVIGLAGTRLAELADRLADRTGLGEAVTGAILLGLVTALPGAATSVVAAIDGLPALAVSNALGGIAVQTAFLAVGDLFHPRANLEHAAASVPNLMQVAVLIALLCLVLLALAGPEFTWLQAHPLSWSSFVVAGLGVWLVRQSRESPMWRPRWTHFTVRYVPEPGARGESLSRLLLAAIPVALGVLLAGALVARVSGDIVRLSGISQTLMGSLFTALATSLPELVTTVAAIRRGALALAIGDIVGGNFFDVLFVSAADLFYPAGSIFHATDVGRSQMFLVGWNLLLNVVVLIGLLLRQRRGPANIGMESVLLLAIYVAGAACLVRGWV